MLKHSTVAKQVATIHSRDLDTYAQIHAIKQVILASDMNEEARALFATDRETIDDILDILYTEYGFGA